MPAIFMGGAARMTTHEQRHYPLQHAWAACNHHGESKTEAAPSACFQNPTHHRASGGEWWRQGDAAEKNGGATAYMMASEASGALEPAEIRSTALQPMARLWLKQLFQC